jgi:hypothetical protein
VKRKILLSLLLVIAVSSICVVFNNSVSTGAQAKKKWFRLNEKKIIPIDKLPVEIQNFCKQRYKERYIDTHDTGPAPKYYGVLFDLNVDKTKERLVFEETGAEDGGVSIFVFQKKKKKWVNVSDGNVNALQVSEVAIGPDKSKGYYNIEGHCFEGDGIVYTYTWNGKMYITQSRNMKDADYIDPEKLYGPPEIK